MRLLVAGALGKVRRAAAAAAQPGGHDVAASDLAPPAYGPTDPAAPPYLRADLADAGQVLDLIGRVRPDAVVHTASIPEPYYLPVDEDHPLRPREAYALSKVLGEHILDALVRRHDQAAPVSAVSMGDPALRAELAELRKDKRRLEVENEILKRAALTG